MKRFLLLSLVLAVSCYLGGNFLAAAEPGFAPPESGSLSYLSNWTEQGKVTLEDGEFRQPVSLGSASELVVRLAGHEAWGTIGGRRLGVVVMATDPGGSGTFLDLALLVEKDGQWQNSDTLPLGDRVRPKNLYFTERGVAVELLRHAPGEPYCCPSQAETRLFIIDEDRLVPPADPQLLGRSWRWRQTVAPGRDRQIPPADGQYFITFQRDGTVTIIADCNQAGGCYRANGGIINLRINQTTMALCPPGSLEQQFLSDLSRVADYHLEKGRLLLGLGHNSGTMSFAP